MPGAARNDRGNVIRRLNGNSLPEGGVFISLQGFQDTEEATMDAYSFSVTVLSDVITPSMVI